jgi:hypothetical protein
MSASLSRDRYTAARLITSPSGSARLPNARHRAARRSNPGTSSWSSARVAGSSPVTDSRASARQCGLRSTPGGGMTSPSRRQPASTGSCCVQRAMAPVAPAQRRPVGFQRVECSHGRTAGREVNGEGHGAVLSVGGRPDGVIPGPGQRPGLRPGLRTSRRVPAGIDRDGDRDRRVNRRPVPVLRPGLCAATRNDRDRHRTRPGPRTGYSSLDRDGPGQRCARSHLGRPGGAVGPLCHPSPHPGPGPAFRSAPGRS